MSMTEKEQALFQKAVTTIKEQNAKLESLTAPVYPMGQIVAVYDKAIVVETQGTTCEMERPAGTDASLLGKNIDINPKTGQLVRVSTYVRYGVTGTVKHLEGNIVQIEAQGGLITVVNGAQEAIQLDDQVILNSSNSVILRKLNKKSAFSYKGDSVLNWDDIGGCADVKKVLIRALELPYSEQKIFSAFPKKPSKGVLLWGPTGNGKTLFGRACAGSLARMHGKESAQTGFIYVKGPELLTKWVGDTELAIRSLFTAAEAHFDANGYPAIIFIDECDALLTRRGTRTASGIEMTVVPQFLSLMDGMNLSHAFALLATNLPDILDPAVVRPGRISNKCYVPAPGKIEAAEIMKIHLRKVPIDKEFTVDALIEYANNQFFSDKFPLKKLTTDKGVRVFTLGNLASGAIVADVVERAMDSALDRSVVRQGVSGLNPQDFDAALQAMYAEQLPLEHYDEVRSYLDKEHLDLTNIERWGEPAPAAKAASAAATTDAPAPARVAVLITPKEGKYDA